MAEPPTPRLFTVDEADALLPTLRNLLRTLTEARQRLLQTEEEIAQRFTGSSQTNGHVVVGGERDRLNQRAAEAQREISHAIRSIAEFGCELKDPERGMVDFRTTREGRVVYLCWLAEEPRVQFWHELDAGYRGRQRLER